MYVTIEPCPQCNNIVCTCTGELAHDNGGSEFTWERDHEGRARLWKARHEWMYAGLALKPGMKVYTVKIAVFSPSIIKILSHDSSKGIVWVESVTTSKLMDYSISHIKGKSVLY